MCVAGLGNVFMGAFERNLCLIAMPCVRDGTREADTSDTVCAERVATVVLGCWAKRMGQTKFRVVKIFVFLLLGIDINVRACIISLFGDVAYLLDKKKCVFVYEPELHASCG